MITAERTMVEPTAYTEDVEMKWTQSDQEAVEATYSQESAEVAGRAECGQEPAGTCGAGAYRGLRTERLLRAVDAGGLPSAR